MENCLLIRAGFPHGACFAFFLGLYRISSNLSSFSSVAVLMQLLW